MVNEILIVSYGRSHHVVEHDRVQDEFTEAIRVCGVVSQNAQIEITVLIVSIRMATRHSSMGLRAERKNNSTAKQPIDAEKSRRKKENDSRDLATILGHYGNLLNRVMSSFLLKRLEIRIMKTTKRALREETRNYHGRGRERRPRIRSIVSQMQQWKEI